MSGGGEGRRRAHQLAPLSEGPPPAATVDTCRSSPGKPAITSPRPPRPARHAPPAGDRRPPFTLQRLAEVLLTPRRYFKVSAKLFNALERLLALTGAEVGLPQGQPPPPQQQQQLLLRQHPAYATLPDAGLTRQQFEAALADAAHPMLGLDDASGSIDMTRVATMEPELDLGGDGQFDNDSGEGDAQLGCDGGGASSGGRLPAESPLSGFYSGDGAPAESVTAAASRLSAGTMGVSLVVDQTPSASHALGLAAAAAAAAAAEEEDGAGEGGQQVVTPPTATAAGGGASLLVSFDGQPPSIASPPPAASLAGASAVSRAAPSAAAAAAAAPAAAPRLPSDPMRALLEAYLDADDDDDDDDGGGGGGSGDAGEASRLAQRQLQQPQALPAPGPREGGAAAGAFDASQFLAAPDSAATLDARAGDTASSAAVAAGSPRRAAPPAGSPPPPPPAVSSALLMAKSPPGGGTSVGVASVLQQPAAANALLAGRLAAAPPSCPPVFAGVGAPGASQMPQAPPLAGDGAAMVDATAAGAAAHHDTPAGSGAAAVSTPGGQLGAAPAAAGPGAAAGAAARAPPPAGVEEAGDGVAAPSPSKRRRLGSAEDAATGGECST